MSDYGGSDTVSVSDSASVVIESEVSDVNAITPVTLELQQAADSSAKRAKFHEYFDFDRDSNTAVCKINKLTKDGNEKPCGKKLQSANFASNLKTHIKSNHPLVFSNLPKDGKTGAGNSNQKKKKATVSQLPLSGFGYSPNAKYPRTHHRQQRVEYHLAKAFGGTSIPFNKIEHEYMVELFEYVDPQITLPGRFKLCTGIESIMQTMVMNLKGDLKEAKRVYVAMDIWSKRRLSESFLGITCLYYCRKSHKKKRVALALKSLPYPHSAEFVLEAFNDVCQFWDIPVEKVHRSLSDNGSNMIKALRLALHERIEAEGDDVVEFEYCDGQPEQQSNPTDIQNLEAEAPEEELEFDTNEVQMNISFGKTNRLRCFCHCINLVASSLDKIESFNELMRCTSTVLRRILSSGPAKEAFKRLAGRFPATVCKTRWIYHYHMARDVIGMKTSIQTICAQFKIDCLLESQYSVLESYLELLRPFAEHCAILEADKGPTLSQVIPSILSLQAQMTRIADTPESEIADAARKLKQRLTDRFKFVFDVQDGDFDPLYAVATFLNPVASFTVRTVPLLLASAKQVVLHECSAEINVGDPMETVFEQGGTQFGGFLMGLEHLAEATQRPNNNLASGTTLPKHEQELKAYEDEFTYYNPRNANINLYDFWNEHKSRFPLLWDYAIDVACCPASSASAERMFSSASAACSGQRAKLGGANLEREVLLMLNKGFY